MNNRIYFGIAQFEDFVYIIGCSLKGQDLKQCEYFEITTMNQRALPSLQQAVRGPNCCTFSHRYIYTVGYETRGDRTSIQQLDIERNSWVVLHTIVDRRIWLVGLHMVDEDTLIMFGGQAISDNNMKYNQIMKYDKETN